MKLTASNSSVRAGDVIVLRCLVEGSNPIPRIRWLKDEQPLEVHPKDQLSQGMDLLLMIFYVCSSKVMSGPTVGRLYTITSGAEQMKLLNSLSS